MMLHGFTGSGRGMAGLARAFEAGYDVIAPGLPGHGRSAPRPPKSGARHPEFGGFEGCVEDLVETMKAAGHRRGHWMGYSMGARLALAVALRHPEAVASLVLIGARAGIADPAERAARRQADEALADRIERNGVEAFVNEWMALPLFATQQRLGPAFLAAARAERLTHSARGLADALRDLGPAAQPLLFDSLPRVTAPALLVAGALDEPFVAAAHELAGRMPNAQVCVIADAGHAVHLEQPAAFTAAALEFLRGAGSAAHAGHQIQSMETLS